MNNKYKRSNYGAKLKKQSNKKIEEILKKQDSLSKEQIIITLNNLCYNQDKRTSRRFKPNMPTTPPKKRNTIRNTRARFMPNMPTPPKK